jgi:hypothetical protein
MPRLIRNVGVLPDGTYSLSGLSPGPYFLLSWGSGRSG